MPICAADPNLGLVTGLLGTVDCYIGDFAQGSYRGLVGPGTMFATVFTALLTIYIALMGYQLLLGRGGLRLTDLPLTALKVGLVLSFLTSWAAYQTLVYDFLFSGPSEIARVLLAQTDRFGATTGGDVFTGLERSFYALTNAAEVYGRQAGGNVNILQGGPALGSGLLWMSAVTMLLVTVGMIVAMKIVLGFLLAVGPVFIGLFLFDATRGLFDGWLRTTVAFALAPLAITVFAAAMLLMLGPAVQRLGELTSQNRFDMGTIVTVAIIVAVSVIVMLQALRAAFGIASGLQTMWRRGGYVPAAGAASAFTVDSDRERARRVATRAAIPAPIEAGGESFRGAAAETRRVQEVVAAVGEGPLPPPRLAEAYRRAPLPTERRDGRWER
jgi:type IV secretion system protein VirB6